MKSFLRSLVSSDGRIGRRRLYFNIAVTWLPLVLFIMLENAGVALFENKVAAPFIFIYMVLLLWSFVTTCIKRCHDLGWSGLRLFLFFIPIANGFLMLFIFFSSGEKKANDWGERPGF